jgi:transcriptional regulator with XRE-family HTH domain
MPKRKTVKINTELVLEMVYAHSWSAASFSKMIGKHERWLSEVKRGKNLPSPEEAANMCALLNAKPKEILMLKGDSPEETAKCLEDIEAVRKLVEADGIKEAPATEGEGLDGKIAQFIRSASAEELTEILRYIDFLESKRKKP